MRKPTQFLGDISLFFVLLAQAKRQSEGQLSYQSRISFNLAKLQKAELK
jgi:hypothetical protein